MSSNEQTTRGQCTEMLANNLYLVAFESKPDKICHLSGKMRLNKIRVVIGDKVDVVIDPYGGKTSNRIVRRA